MSEQSTADPTRIVADADVLAADLLVGGAARDVLDQIRRHSWLTLVASERLLADASALVATLTDDELAADWHERIEAECEIFAQPERDHPGLAAAYRGDAAHLLSYDEDLSSARTGLAIQSAVSLSVRSPEAFRTVFDPAALYEATHDEDYPGPDRDPRA